MVAAAEAIPIPYPQPNTRFSPSRAVTVTSPMFSIPLWEDDVPEQPTIPMMFTDGPTSTIVPLPTENFIPNPGDIATPGIAGGNYEYILQPIDSTTDDQRYGQARIYINPFSGVR